jgi:hypothetical protein
MPHTTLILAVLSRDTHLYRVPRFFEPHYVARLRIVAILADAKATTKKPSKVCLRTERQAAARDRQRASVAAA